MESGRYFTEHILRQAEEAHAYRRLERAQVDPRLTPQLTPGLTPELMTEKPNETRQLEARSAYAPIGLTGRMVEVVACLGVPQEDIAKAVGISAPTLHQHFRQLEAQRLPLRREPAHECGGPVSTEAEPRATEAKTEASGTGHLSAAERNTRTGIEKE
jgi:hypothetical protein